MKYDNGSILDHEIADKIGLHDQNSKIKSNSSSLELIKAT